MASSKVSSGKDVRVHGIVTQVSRAEGNLYVKIDTCPDTIVFKRGDQIGPGQVEDLQEGCRIFVRGLTRTSYARPNGKKISWSNVDAYFLSFPQSSPPNIQ